MSVVIPALDEQSQIERALSSTRLPRVERIVVDGGSTDGTSETARFLRAEKVIHALPGRAAQMDAGLREARGEIVLFLHADTRLEAAWLSQLAEAMTDPATAGGAFRLGFDRAGWIYRLLEAGVWLRCRMLRLPYGDQGLFVRRKLLLEGGGVPRTPIFEDLDLVERIRAAGRLVLLPARAWTSTRRYECNGLVRQLARNLLGLGAYLLRLDRDRVAAWYRARPAR